MTKHKKKKSFHKNIPTIVSIVILLLGGIYIIQGYSSAEKEYENINFTIQSDSDFSCSNVKEIPNTECEALVTLYKSTNGDLRNDNERRLRNKYPCSWRGVLCKDGNVVALNLSKNNLQGTLPSNIAWLSEMFALYLADNKLEGILPSSLLAMKNLQHIELSKNKFSGSIPKEIALLGINTTDTALFLNNNQLCNTIPESMVNNKNIELMRVRQNYLTLSEENYSETMRTRLKNVLTEEDIKEQYPELCN